MSIGHEMTHGFDDQGRQYDGHGVLTDWWTPEDAAKFVAQTKRLGGQYDQFEPVSGAHVNGDLTMGENIADLGGLLLALDAYHVSLKGAPAPVLDGLTGDQRVFLGWAQVWRSAAKEDAKRRVSGDRSALAAGGPGQRRGAQYRRLVRGLRRQAGPGALRRAGPARPDLVTTTKGRRLSATTPVFALT